MIPKIQKDGFRYYGQWAGNTKGTKEDPTRCIQEVWERGRAIRSYQCFRKRGYGPDGNFCKQHAKMQAQE